jgi:hypothetical protein
MPAEFHGKEVARKAVEFFLGSNDDFRKSKEAQLVLDPTDYNREQDCLKGPSKDNGKLPAIVAGAIDEDGLHVLPSSEQALEYRCDPTIYLHHAWNPNTNRGWNIEGHTSILNDTGLEWANYYFYWALEEYWAGRRARAYYLLGRSIHLLGDAATPAHAHGDPHISDMGDFDGYENSLSGCEVFCSLLSDCGERLDYAQIRLLDQLKAEYPEISEELERNAANYFELKSPIPLAEILWEKGPRIQQKRPRNEQDRVDTDLFHIFYYAAERADDFPSEDVSGEDSDLRIDDADIYIRIGEELVPVAVQSTVALLELFWDRTHSTRILTQGHLIPLRPGEQTTVYLEIQNVGPVTWEAGEFVLENVGGHTLGAEPLQLLITDVPRGYFVRWKLSITAPSLLGKYPSEWQMKKLDVPVAPIQSFAVIVLPEGEFEFDPGALLEEWLNELIEQITAELNKFWEDLKRQFMEWLQSELERLWREFWESLLQQCCGANAVAPAALVLGAWGFNRRRRRRMKDDGKH